MDADLLSKQLAFCARYDVMPVVAPDDMKLGLARNVLEGLQPINGLRVFPVGDTTGWYIWAGEQWSDEPDFFQPIHVNHLVDQCPLVLEYLQLPPGWRFLLAPDYEDVWFDAELLRRS